MVAAIAVIVLGALIITAIMMSSRSSSELARDRLERTAAELLAQDAGTALAGAFSTLAAGEHNGFVLSQETLQQHAVENGGSAVSNSSMPGDMQTVDHMRVPDRGRFTVRFPLQDGRTGYWQVYSMKLPEWGETPGGRVAVYIRVWTSVDTDPNNFTQPSLYRLELRPTWFSDFQMIFDGRGLFGNGARINGRVHSNGHPTSFFGIYDYFAGSTQIILNPETVCESGARITTSSGTIERSGGCNAAVRDGTTPRYDLLRASDHSGALREICESGEAITVQMACPTSTEMSFVSLSGTTLRYSLCSGCPWASLSAAVTGDDSRANQGAVFLARGDVQVSGELGDGARALVVTSSENGTATGTGGAPSVWVISPGTIGSSGADSSSFGIVAEGDLMLDERTACPVTFRGSLVAMTGMLSSHRTWRVPMPVNGGETCSSGTPAAAISGSIAAHYVANMASPVNGSGYATRSYEYAPALFDNPPPLAATAGDWQVVKLATGSPDCFRSAGGGFTLKTNEEQPGCA
jgi:hypothetical protein